MKSQMKSAFAIIAVALMIMVAVVPMVGVFTEDSSAASDTTVTDPKTQTGAIKMTFTLYDAKGKQTSNSTSKIQLTWGTDNAKILSVANGSVTETFRESKMTGAVATVGNEVLGVFVPDTDYTEYIIGDVSAGAILNVDLYKGYTQSGAVTFNAKNISVYQTVKTLGGDVYVNYSTAKDNGGATIIDSSKEALMKSSSQFEVEYPTTETSVYVKVNYITVDGTQYPFTTATWESVGSSTKTLTAEQFAFVVQGMAGLPDDVRVSNLVSAAGTVTTFTVIDDTIGKTINDCAIFIYKADAALTDITYSLTFGSVTIDDVKNATDGGSGRAPALSGKAVFGAYKMGNVNASDGANLKIVAKDSGAEGAQKTAEETAYVAGGYFLAKVPSITEPTGSVTYTASSDDFTVSGTVNVAESQTTITAATTGFTLVTAKVANASAGFQVTVNGLDGAKTFGLNDNKGTIAGSIGSATFSFYVEGNRYISFTAQDGSQFNDASSGSYFIPISTSPKNIDLTLKDKVMKFVFTDSDGKSISADMTINVINADGEVVTGTTTAGATYTYKLTDASLILSDLYVYFTNSNTTTKQTFEAYDELTAIPYEPTDGKMAVSSLEKTFYLTVKDANGNILRGESDKPSAYYAEAYVAEDGTKVYTYNQQVTLTAMSNGSYSYRVAKDLVDVTLTGVEQDVVIFIKNASTTYYFNETPYLATTDMTIAAIADSITATIFKTDGVTPIANTMFELRVGDEGAPIDVQTTDVNGKITFTADAQIPDGAKIVASSAKIGDISNSISTVSTDVKKEGVPYSMFYATYDVYKIDITDADGKVFDGAESTNVLEITNFGESVVLGGSYAVDNDGVITVSLAADAGDELAIALAVSSSDSKAVRTFDNYTLTADNIKNGTISLVSNESTYTVSATDADGKSVKLNGTVTVVKSKVGGATPATITPSASVVYQATANSSETEIKFVITAPASNQVYVADIVGQDTSYALTAGIYYAFNEKNAAVAVSKNSTITFELVDATGATISTILNQNVSVNTSIAPTYISGTNKYYFVGDATATNKVTVADGPDYTFTAAQKIVDGVVKAKQQTVVFTAVDAAGEPIVGGGFTIKQIAANGAITDLAESVTFKENGVYSRVMIVDSTVTYALVDNDYAFGTGYTFTANGTKFTAAEQTLQFTFTFANGVNLSLSKFAQTEQRLTVYSIECIGKDGISETIRPTGMYNYNAKIIINTTDVASYIVNIGGLTFTGTTGNVTSDLSLVTGFVGAGVESVNISCFNGTTQVGAGTLPVDEDGKYIMVFDFVNAPYDKVLVQYYVSGVLTSQATIDAKTGYVADLVSVTPIAETLKAKVLDSEKSYVKLDFANGKVYLTADDKYTVETVDGLYVQTYKFAGWYVNGVKVTDDLNCSVDNVDTNVVSANYVLDDSKELGKESAAGVDPTVIAIGIAAVIIALFAVIYAVIQKRE